MRPGAEAVYNDPESLRASSCAAPDLADSAVEMPQKMTSEDSRIRRAGVRPCSCTLRCEPAELAAAPNFQISTPKVFPELEPTLDPGRRGSGYAQNCSWPRNQ